MAAKSNAMLKSPAADVSKRPEPVRSSKALLLDPLIHERTRLAIVSALAAGGEQTFRELKQLLQLTDGNLSVHCRKLEQAEYISCEKTFEKRMPKTTYQLTPKGLHELGRYLEHMEAVIEAARKR